MLYKRPCRAPGHDEEMVSIYAPERPFNVVDQKYWWSDEWDPLAFGKSYDFSRPFFTQFRELMEQVPLLTVSNSNAVNSDYCNVADQSKDSYLSSGSYKIERTHYSNRVYTTKDSSDLYACFRDELCYECVLCNDCYRVRWSRDCIACQDSAFLYDCKNCTNCVGCVSLRNKNHHIFNVAYTKEEYEKKLKELQLDTREGLERVAKEWERLMLGTVHRYANILRSVNATGDNIGDAKNCRYAFDITEGMEDAKYVHWGGLQTHDAYDSGPGIGDVAELTYEVTDSGLQSSDLAFTNVVYGSQRIRYALYCHGSRDLFGCIGLRNKQYCILNKQYTKEEYEALLPKIIVHMNGVPYVDAKGRIYKYGEFFPMEISPMAYNESIAQDYFPVTREIALARGYVWREAEERKHAITMRASDIPNAIKEVGENVTKDVIECADQGRCTHGCAGAFRVVPQELEFYRRLSIPLPRFCFNCRHARRLAQRNPMKLWHRKCQCAGAKSENGVYTNTVTHQHHGNGHCTNEFETSYAPERPETVYCEQCYQAEVV